MLQDTQRQVKLVEMHQTKMKKKMDEGHFSQCMLQHTQRQVKVVEMHQTKVKKTTG